MLVYDVKLLAYLTGCNTTKPSSSSNSGLNQHAIHYNRSTLYSVGLVCCRDLQSMLAGSDDVQVVQPLRRNVITTSGNSRRNLLRSHILPSCMECRRGLAMGILSDCLSVRPSVKRVHCDKTEESYV